MHYIYDFDGTLFATQMLWEAWVDALVEFNLTPEQIIAEGEKLIPIGFSLESHAQCLGLEGKAVDKVISKFNSVMKDKGPELVFPDVMPFLTENEDDTHSVLTFGDADFQAQKIELSGIGDKLEDINFARPDKTKSDYLRELVEMSSEPIVFIDDNPRTLLDVHDKGLPITLIRMVREGERHKEPHECDGDLWQCISSLDEIAQLI